jgi:hypothetical protein
MTKPSISSHIKRLVSLAADYWNDDRQKMSKDLFLYKNFEKFSSNYSRDHSETTEFCEKIIEYLENGMTEYAAML